MSIELLKERLTSDAGDAYQAYLRVRTSLYHFSRLPSDVEDESDRKKLDTEVLKQQAINRSVQSSSEYARMVVTEQELGLALREIYDQVPEQLDLDEVLQSNGLNQDSLRKAIELDLRVAAVLNYIAEQQPEVSDVDAELFFQLHTERFVVPEQRVARHILVTINDQYPENKRDVALARIKKVQRELVKKAFKFEKLAKSTSECPTALEGGLLGAVSLGQLYPDVEAVLFAMEEGAVSDVVESPLGFHVLKCESITPRRDMPFQDVRDKVKTALRKRNQRAAQRQWLQQRMKATAVTS